jgi:hypothetical protein
MKDYHKEMKIAIIKVNMVEDRKTITARFLDKLNKEIINVIELQHYMEVKKTWFIWLRKWRDNLEGKEMFNQRSIWAFHHLGNQI